MEKSVLVLSLLLGATWLVGALLAWWNLRRQEQMIGSLRQLTLHLLHDPARRHAEVPPLTPPAPPGRLRAGR